MRDDRPNERTETDERVAENQSHARVTDVVEQPDDDVSPLDRGKQLDPFGGKAPSERIPAMKPGHAQDQAFGSVNEPRKQ